MDNTQRNNQEEYEIDLLELWYLFLAKLKFIIIFAIIGGMLAFGYTHHFVEPTYKATSKLYIVSASSDSVVNLTDLQIGANLTQDYKELILSRPMLESCARSLGINSTDLDKMISVDNPTNTRIIKISVTHTDPELARDIANKMASLSTTWLPEVMEIAKPNIAEEAVTPQEKSAPNLTKNTIIGAIALAGLYFAICVIKHLLDDTIKTGEDLEKYFNITPLTQVPEVDEKRKGKK